MTADLNFQSTSKQPSKNNSKPPSPNFSPQSTHLPLIGIPHGSQLQGSAKEPDQGWHEPTTNHQDTMVHLQRMWNVLQGYSRQRAVWPNVCTGLHHTGLWKEAPMRCDKDHKEDPNSMNKKFNIFCSCLQGTVVTKCDPCAMRYKGMKQTTENLRTASKITLKQSPSASISETRWLMATLEEQARTPAVRRISRSLSLDIGLCQKGYLSRRMEPPSNTELCKQVFLAQHPKPHHIKSVKNMERSRQICSLSRIFLRAATMLIFALASFPHA